MKYVAVPGVSDFSRKAVPESRPSSCWLVGKIQEIFRNIVIYFTPYAQLDLENRIARLAKMRPGKSFINCLNFEANRIVKSSRRGLQAFYGELEKFQGVEEWIYTKLLEQFSEEKKMGELFEAAVAEIQQGKTNAWNVGQSLVGRGVLPEIEGNTFTTNLMKKIAQIERANALTKKLENLLKEQGIFFQLLQSLGEIYLEKESLMSKVLTEDTLENFVQGLDEQKRSDLKKCIENLDEINQKIARFKGQIQKTSQNMAEPRMYSKKELNAVQKREIEQIEREISVQKQSCKERWFHLEKKNEKLSLQEAFLREAVSEKTENLQQVGQSYQYVSQDF